MTHNGASQKQRGERIHAPCLFDKPDRLPGRRLSGKMNHQIGRHIRHDAIHRRFVGQIADHRFKAGKMRGVIWSRQHNNLRISESAAQRQRHMRADEPCSASDQDSFIARHRGGDLSSAQGLATQSFEIGVEHFLDHRLQIDLRLPAQRLARLAGIAKQHIDFRRTEKRRINDQILVHVETGMGEGDLTDDFITDGEDLNSVVAGLAPDLGDEDEE